MANNNNHVLQIAAWWVPQAVAVTLLALLVYGTVQQALSTSANDPQIQLAQDAAAALANGVSPQTIVGNGTVDIAKSLAPYLVIYDDRGQALAASARLDGATPILPTGVLAYVREHGEDRIT